MDDKLRMTELDTRVTELIEPEARALGFDLVRVKLFGGAGDRTLQVMAERPDTRQLTIDDCAELSRRVSDLFDRLETEGDDPIDEAYRLEVSSPGIDRPLTRLQDYADWSGHEARLTLDAAIDGQKQFKGELTGIEGDTVTIRARDGAIATLPFDRIADGKLVLTDRLIAATQPLSTQGVDDIVEVPGEDVEEFKEEGQD